jgi:uncharacterized membrane protein
MKKNNQFINIEVKMLIENQRASIRFYTIFAAALLIVGIGLILFVYFNKSVNTSSDNTILNSIMSASATLITALSAIPLKEIIAKREKLTAYQIVKHHLEELDDGSDNTNENEVQKMRELIWKVIENTTLA